MFGPPILINFFIYYWHTECVRCANTIGAGWTCAPIYWRTDVPLCQQAILTKYGEPIMIRRFFCVRPAITIGAGGIGAPIVLADYKEDDCVRGASPIFIPIAY